MNRADPLSEIEREQLRLSLERGCPRDRLLIELGLQTGLRTSELLSLQLGQVWDGHEPLTHLRIQRRNLKGGHGRNARVVKSRVIPLSTRARRTIAQCCPALGHDLAAPLFSSREGAGRSISRRQVARLIREACLRAGLSPHKIWSGHSLRRSFAKSIFAEHGIEITRAALGHSSISTTQIYVAAGEAEVHAAILSLGADPIHDGELRPQLASVG